MAEVVEAQRLSPALHKTGVGVSRTLNELLVPLFLLFAVLGVNTVLHRLLIKPLKICGWLRFHGNALQNVVAGIRPHMGGIREQQFAVNETVLNALPNHFVEQFLEQRSAIEFAAAQLGEGRVVGYRLVEVDAEKPAVCDVDAHFLLQAPFRVYAVQVTEQQHLDNDHRVDGRPASA